MTTKLGMLAAIAVVASVCGGCSLNRSGTTTPNGTVVFCNFYEKPCNDENVELMTFRDADDNPKAYEVCRDSKPLYDEKVGVRICVSSDGFESPERTCQDVCEHMANCGGSRPVHSGAVPATSYAAWSCVDGKGPIVQLPLTMDATTQKLTSMITPTGPRMNADPVAGSAKVHVSVDGPRDDSTIVPVQDGRVSVLPLGCTKIWGINYCQYRFERLELALRNFSLYGKSVQGARMAALEPFDVWVAIEAGPQGYFNSPVRFSASMTADGVPIGGESSTTGQIFTHVHYLDANSAPWIYVSATLKKTIANVFLGQDATGTFTIDAWFHASDLDGDWIFDHLDNCPYDWNANQVDSDGNGRGDACDLVVHRVPMRL